MPPDTTTILRLTSATLNSDGARNTKARNSQQTGSNVRESYSKTVLSHPQHDNKLNATRVNPYLDEAQFSVTSREQTKNENQPSKHHVNQPTRQKNIFVFVLTTPDLRVFYLDVTDEMGDYHRTDFASQSLAASLASLPSATVTLVIGPPNSGSLLSVLGGLRPPPVMGGTDE
ncbi:hypothetical protein FHG87_011448 [Trinorchestia longiramus]|nr:hypothetical protein FHG87_011448 [Trinorchestia longiramus]